MKEARNSPAGDDWVAADERMQALANAGPIGRSGDAAALETAGGRPIAATRCDISEFQRAEAEVRRLNRSLEVLSECKKALVHARSDAELMAQICRTLADAAGYRSAWAGIAEYDAGKSVRRLAHAGVLVDDLVRQPDVSWAGAETGRDPTGAVIRERRTVVCRYLRSDPQFGYWREAALANGYGSLIALPLRDGEAVIGVLVIHAAAEDAFDSEELLLLEGLADDIAFRMADLRRQAAQRKARAKRASRADHDVQTGLANRGLLCNRLGLVLALCERSRRSLAVLVLDVDAFAAINESFGHPAGDAMLGEVGRRLADCMLDSDAVARLEGDRFAVVAVDLACDEDADRFVRKVMAAFADPFVLDGKEICLTACVGVALYPRGGTTAELLLKNAEAAVNRAKKQGRGQFRFYTEDLNAGALARFELEGALWQAIERDELLLYYQPKVDLQTGLVSGVEALLRWQRPGHGMVAPLEFVPLAEKSGLIVNIGTWVIDAACGQLRAWLDAGFSDMQVAVNVSARQFRAGDLKSVITRALRRHRVPAQQLELEVTESMLMESPKDAAAQLSELKQIGVQLALDDFGTGYSSLAYLGRFPIDTLKIDRSFVTDIVSEPDAACIANSIIALAHRMRLKVVAEGVENEAQLVYLQRNRCDEIQGYYFSRPLAADALTQLLREGKSLPAAGNAADGADVHTLLVVDDEPHVLSAVKRLFRRAPYRLLTAANAREGLDLLAKNVVQVVLSDQRMPEMNGSEFFRRVKELHPNTVRIILSGYADLETITSAVNEGALYKFLTKPWEDAHLREQVSDAFRYYDAVIGPRAALVEEAAQEAKGEGHSES